jgi:glycerate 2-kinase|nr:MAG: glycerate kinase [Thermoproteus sp. AZ2]
MVLDTRPPLIEAILRAADLIPLTKSRAGPLGDIRLVAIGKGASAMAQALAEVARIEDGLVVSPADVPPPKGLRLIVADHPRPSARSFRAGREVLDYVSSLGKGDTLVLAISGGASALAEVPLISEEDLLAVWNLLLTSGLDIHEVNAVRKRLSAIKGGRLGALAAGRGVRVVNVVASDVPCDDPSDVGSGPGVPDNTTPEDAYRALKIRGLWGRLPESAKALIESMRGRADTPRQFPHEVRVVARNADVLEAVKRSFGGEAITSCAVGEARELGKAVAYIARERGAPIILGGEPSVTVRGRGRGGRTTEFALAFALHARGGLAALALATDGLDGNTGVAGVWADPLLLGDLEALGLSVEELFADNDTYRPFEATGRVVATGPTGTNLNLVFYIDRWSRLSKLLGLEAGGEVQEGQINGHV